MSEAELHILKSRMHEGRRAKAQRGELVLGLPRGYVLKPSGEIALDPDEGVRQVIGLVFAVFERRRSVSGLPRYLVDHDIQLPDRVRAGPDKGEVRWSRWPQTRTRYRGTPRGGTALLGGLVSCGVCGRRMFTTYTENGREARYVCHQMAITFGARRCQSISAQCVDALISAAMLEALSPSAIEVSLQVAEDLELERQQLRGQWKQRLERASYETALARRRYESVDPTNRLVARTLERDWDVALAAEQKLGDNYHRAVSREPEQLSDEEKHAVRLLADDVPTLWRATSTTASDRQAIARLMLDRVVILVRGTTEHADLTCHWAGGIVTRHPLIRPVRRFEQLEQFDQLIARITEMRRGDATAQDIADRLNIEGWKPPKKQASTRR